MPFFALPIACSQPVDESLGSPDPVATARGAADGLPSCSGTRLTVTIAADTGLRLDVPGNNYGTERSLHIGKPLTGDRQMMMLFDVSAVPAGALVQWAKVTVHGGSASAGIIDVYPVTVPWAEYTVTWNSFGNGIAAAPLSNFTSAAYNSASITTVFDFLPEAQGWVSGTLTNRGVVLKNRSTAASAVAIFKSRESPDGPAKLDLCYEPPHSNFCAGVTCVPLDQCHVAGVCNPASGQCSSPLKANGAGCDDHNACTTADTCQGGICTGGAPLSCTAAHGSAACSGGSCEITGCVGSYRDCDGDPATGCEVDTSTSVSQCGGCHLPCPSAPNTVSSCSGGVCGSACAAGFADCDGSAVNGCETALGTVQSCGGCGNVCAAPHASGACNGGACGLGACAPGFADCDGNVANGCETALDSAQSCGACGNVCVAAHAVSGCGGGVCTVASCSAGFGDCDGNVVNGCETALGTTSNCGACGASCATAHGTPACLGGACGVGACNAGFGDCDGSAANGCETALDTAASCGACGHACGAPHAATACVSGACILQGCNAGFGDCDGSAANGCETALDSFGTCGGTLCDTAHGNCDGNPQNGCETALDTAQNCGGCGVSCAAAHGTPACDHGACAVAACDPGWANCDCSLGDGCETDTRVDAQNCGGCGVVCAAGASCVQGVCQ